MEVDVSDPEWSPDGTKIVFSEELGVGLVFRTFPTREIWVMNADGSNGTTLTNPSGLGANSYSPDWSPDGTKILFYSQRALDDGAGANPVGNIWVINGDGTGIKPLTHLTVANYTFGAVWSPDGTKIAFSSGRALDGSDNNGVNATANIWIMNPDGSGATPLTKLTAYGAGSEAPVWSPDGKKIAFVSERALDGSDGAHSGSPYNVWVMNADGSGATPLTRLTASGADSGGIAWSHDGGQIAFDSKRALDGTDAGNTASNIWVMSADGTSAKALTRITASGGDSHSPRWAP